MSQFDLSEVHYPAGTEFFCACGDIGCFIESGEIRVWIERDGNEVTLATLGEGELFG